MTIEEIRAIALEGDPEAQRYEHSRRGDGEAYTTWQESRTLGYMGDGRHMGVTRFQIDRFTKTEDDETAQRIEDTLEERDDVAFEHIVDYETDTGYIHHIFDCEGA